TTGINDTFYYNDNSNGIGLFASDDVSRLHSKEVFEKNLMQGGLIDDSFMLKSEGNAGISNVYKKTWYIYPTTGDNNSPPGSGFFDFINSLRVDLKSNFPIAGSIIVGDISKQTLPAKTCTSCGVIFDNYTLNPDPNKPVYATLSWSQIENPTTLKNYLAQAAASYVVLSMPITATLS